MSYKPTREEVETFLQALNYGMKVEYKKDFMIALAGVWLNKNSREGLFLRTIDLNPGDVVKIAGSVNDRTVENVAQQEGRCVTVSWTDGNSTRYRYDKTHTVFR